MARKEYIHTNLTGNSVHTLMPRDRYKDIEITGMTISNVHETDTVYVDLFLRSKIIQGQRKFLNENITDWNAVTSTYTDLYIMKNIEITLNNTLILEPREVDYNSKEYSLVMQLSEADSAVDIMINFKQER